MIALYLALLASAEARAAPARPCAYATRPTKPEIETDPHLMVPTSPYMNIMLVVGPAARSTVPLQLAEAVHAMLALYLIMLTSA